MKKIEPQDLSENEEYANAYHHFHKALAILASDAETQCEIMGNFNVAWEIKDDILRGIRVILDLPGGQLSEDQKEALSRLMAAVSAVPANVVNVPNVKEAHKAAMNDPCWIPIRVYAKELLALLEPETRRTNAILGM